MTRVQKYMSILNLNSEAPSAMANIDLGRRGHKDYWPRPYTTSSYVHIHSNSTSSLIKRFISRFYKNVYIDVIGDIIRNYESTLKSCNIVKIDD